MRSGQRQAEIKMELWPYMYLSTGVRRDDDDDSNTPPEEYYSSVVNVKQIYCYCVVVI